MVQIPTEAELTRRIRWHVEHRPGRPDVVQTWSGYLSALVEWGLIDLAMCERLQNLLPPGNRHATIEIALGEYSDEHPELFEDEAAPAKVA